MPELYLPESVLAERRAVFAAEITARCEPSALADAYSELLQQVDPALCMVKARQLISPGTPLVPGCYHVLRTNPGAPMSVFPVTDEHGAFVEPTSRVLDRLRAGDLRNRDVYRQVTEAPRRQHEAAERERERDNAERREHLSELVDAYTRTSISTNRDSPWTQNQAGRRGARGRPA